MSNKAIEIYSKILTITKRSVKIVEKRMNDFIGSNDDLTHFAKGGGNNEYLWDFSQGEKLVQDLEAKREQYKKEYKIKRATKIHEVAECNDFNTMITLTFRPEDNQSEEQVKKNWALAKKRLEYRHGKFKYICALERGKEEYTNHLHFHILTDIEYINNHSKYWNNKDGSQTINEKWFETEDDIIELIDTTSNRSKELKNKRIEMYNDGASYLKVLLGFGHVHVKALNEEMVKYITKYVSKDKQMNEKYKRTIWCSRGLEKPVKIYTDDVIDYVLENIPTDFTGYRQSSFSFENSDLEIIKVQSFSYSNISDFYYMCKTARLGNEIYLKDIAYTNKKSYEYTFNLFNPKVEKDYKYYYERNGVYKNKKYKKECVF